LTASPLFGAILLPITLAYAAVQRFYSSSSRELKRIEAATRAPLLSHVASSLDGLPTIRAFDARRRFGVQCEAALDENLRASLTSSLVNCWLGLRLELLGALISAAAAALAFARNTAAAPAFLKAGLSGAGGVGTAALGLTLALQVSRRLMQ
jgi:ABC-type multidrug transport system fused ATPase/permease subunit